jgi:rubrerythrin
MGAPLALDAYDWTRARDQLLTPDEIFQITYAAQVEWATEGTFESLDITDDPLVKRFLRTWLTQEVVHGKLLARFLTAYGVTVPILHESWRQRFGARRGRWVNALVHRIVGDDFFAVHMTWGAINELMTLRFYALIRDASANALLRDLLRDLIAQESVHYRFYRAMAEQQLAGNPRAQRLVRWSLEHLWSPVGSGLRGRADGDHLVLSLVAHRPDAVARIDGTLERIPGLRDLGLVRREVARARARAFAA